jgi:hypothetical protein
MNYKPIDYCDPEDSYCGLFNIKKESKKAFVIDKETQKTKMISLDDFKIPEKGEKGIFKVPKGRNRVKSFEGLVIQKYGDDHIVVENLSSLSKSKENFYKSDFLSKQVFFKAIPVAKVQ